MVERSKATIARSGVYLDQENGGSNPPQGRVTERDGGVRIDFYRRLLPPQKGRFIRIIILMCLYLCLYQVHIYIYIYLYHALLRKIRAHGAKLSYKLGKAEAR